VLSVGSCFAERMGAFMTASKMSVDVNPAGIVFNPVSIASTLDLAVRGEPLGEDDLFHDGYLYHSWLHHSSFDHTQKDVALRAMNERILAAHRAMREAKVLIVTVGTAYVWRLKATGQVVANCHKMPANLFEKVLLSPLEAQKSLAAALEACRALNDELQVVATVSPVRHARDGLTQSSRSKAHLLAAVHAVADDMPFVRYFPSYEIVMDDLRDYRFFADDMLHPSPAAEEYIFDAFAACWLKDETRSIVAEVAKVQRAVAHRPRQPQSPAYQQHVDRALAELSRLERVHGLNMQEERGVLEARRGGGDA